MEQELQRLSDGRKKLFDRINLFGPFILVGLVFVSYLYIEIARIDLSKELRDSICSTTGTIFHLLSIVCCILYGRKYGLGWMKSVIFSLSGLWGAFSYVSQWWASLDNAVLGYGSIAPFRTTLLLPILALILSRMSDKSVLNLCDYLIPYYWFKHSAATTACWLTGCCAGRAMSWGLLNPLTGRYAFPVQPYNIVVAACVSLWGLLHAKKKNYQTHGEVFANSILTYGFFRYIVEFFTDTPRLIGPLSLYSVYSLLLVVLGFVILYTGKGSAKKDTDSKNVKNSMEDLI